MRDIGVAHWQTTIICATDSLTCLWLFGIQNVCTHRSCHQMLTTYTYTHICIHRHGLMEWQFAHCDLTYRFRRYDFGKYRQLETLQLPDAVTVNMWQGASLEFWKVETLRAWNNGDLELRHFEACCQVVTPYMSKELDVRQHINWLCELSHDIALSQSIYSMHTSPDVAPCTVVVWCGLNPTDFIGYSMHTNPNVAPCTV